MPDKEPRPTTSGAGARIVAQHDAGRGWTFDVELAPSGGRPHRLTMDLSWADYNHWSPDGADRPADVARAVISFLLEQETAGDVPRRFDAAAVRRRYPAADRQIPGLIRRG